jgi:hypothetical protein
MIMSATEWRGPSQERVPSAALGASSGPRPALRSSEGSQKTSDPANTAAKLRVTVLRLE